MQASATVLDLMFLALVGGVAVRTLSGSGFLGSAIPVAYPDRST